MIFIQYLYFSFKVSIFGTSEPKCLGCDMLYLNKTVNFLEETFWAWKEGEWFGWNIFETDCSLAQLLHQGFCSARTEHGAEGKFVLNECFGLHFDLVLKKVTLGFFEDANVCMHFFYWFVCVSSLHVCMFCTVMCRAWIDQKRTPNLLGLEQQVIVSPLVCDGNWTQYLSKKNKCSLVQTLQHLMILI